MINFNIELGGFRLTERNRKKELLKRIIREHGFRPGELNYIFMSDDDLLKINIEYLNHSTYTDIITFDNSETDDTIEGDIFISVDRVRENAEKFGTGFESELVRVMAHGVLHLAGYKDKKPEEAQAMRAAEEKALKAYFTDES
ncbi:rRNA maturation RNase YbeY [Leadbetterella sp. DM7]|uniref:rRNA maturation RNase YbeY n=1 Tax=Leadbetterella sp. DM7 TaxID=3235085 RepID=UPI00349EF526